MYSDSESEGFSLLWPAQIPQPDRPAVHIPVRTIRDLGLENLIANITGNAQERQALEKVILHLSDNPAVIKYRQEILQDLHAHPQLVAGLEALLPEMEGLTAHYFQRGVLYEKSHLYEVTWRLGELESMVTCVQTLQKLLDPQKQHLHARGWRRLHTVVEKIAADPAFQEMQRELPELLARVRQTRSVTIGINLDHNLLPVQATLLSLNKERFSGAGFLGRLFNRGDDETRGIAPLHDLMADAASRMPTAPLVSAAPQGRSPLMVPLFRDLGDVLNKVSRSINLMLTEYKRLHGRLFASLWSELLFFLTAERLARKMERFGLPMCLPEISAKAERVGDVEEHYNLNLALHLAIGYEKIDLRQKIVSHHYVLGEEGRIQILTGPNGGGKTTYLQAVGLTQLLAQAGLYIPGRAGRISPVDRLFTHFPVEEKLENGKGRFGEEAQRLYEIFQDLTPHSLLLLNESLSSTNTGESLYLAEDLVRLLRQIGLRAIFATHMHELAAMTPQMNTVSGASRIISVVASRIESEAEDDGKFLPRSFQIVPGPPMGHSYARQLAARYGISYDQLQQDLRRRGILDQ